MPSNPRNLWQRILPITHEDNEITCFDSLGNLHKHVQEQRYVSPTTGRCRRLIVQCVNPAARHEVRIKDNTGQANRLAMELAFTNPFRDGRFLQWIAAWFEFNFIIILSVIWFLVMIAYLVASLALGLEDILDFTEDSATDYSGNYKPYPRKYFGQLWAARSTKEYSSRHKNGDPKEKHTPTHSLYPRLLMIRDSESDKWSRCDVADTIIKTKYVAISYHSVDVFSSGPNEGSDKDRFIQEVRAAVVRMNFNAYWLDSECTEKDKLHLDLYCMADVYRGAAATLVMLGHSWWEDGEKGAWRRWGGRVWTLPEALLSHKLYRKFRDLDEIRDLSLHELVNYAYEEGGLEQAIIHHYSGKDPLGRLELLTLLKSAIWRRGITITTPEPTGKPNTLPSLPPPTDGTPAPYPASRVYALMGFFQHRIKPHPSESDLLALARLSMANDSDRIAERMVSLLPSTIDPAARWYADTDLYNANLWDIDPEIQAAGVTENGALVLDGCKAASIRWKNFPHIKLDQANSVINSLIAFVAYLAWPILIVGAAATMITKIGGIILIVIGVLLVLAAPRLYVFGESGRLLTAQPWLIGVKGVLHVDEAAKHLYGGGNTGRYPRLMYTPSGSEFAAPDEGTFRKGSNVQYQMALKAEKGDFSGRMYTLIDTYSSTIYYFRADRPPTVCLFTGREGGLGRFVLCSERCGKNELHKETVLRMPTEVNQKMETCRWIAVG